MPRIAVLHRALPPARILAAALAALILVGFATAVAHALARRVVLQEGLAFKPREMAISGDGDFTVRRLRSGVWQLISQS